LPTLIVIASANAHKTEEIQTLLGPEFECRTLGDFPGAPEPEEDAATFAGNAVKKALSLVNWLKQNEDWQEGWILADDSGLEVDALEGAPGVHSARYAATANHPGNSHDEKNNAKLLAELKGRAPHHRAARFRCVLALARAGQYSQPQLFIGTCEGRIDEAPHGEHGFGYDPLFIPEGHDQTFAELGDSIKSQLSHRAAALRQLKNWMEAR
jgi:XTP/dITP diphosphohydrolase